MRVLNASHGLIMAVLMLGVSYFVQADGASDSAWAWYVTVEDPQGKMGTTASVYLLTETTISLSSLDSAIANGNFDAQIATRHFLLTLGQQDVYFNVPYALNEFNQHGIYVLFSDGDPLKSKYYSVGYFATFREGLASPPPGFYFDSDG